LQPLLGLQARGFGRTALFRAFFIGPFKPGDRIALDPVVGPFMDHQMTVRV
jgi:hypothetical protein